MCVESKQLTKIETEFTVENAGLTVVDEIQSRIGLSKVRIKEAMNKRAVWTTQGKRTARVRLAKALTRSGDVIAIYYDEKILNTEPPAPTLIADKVKYSVRHKPAGLMSSGSRFGDHCVILNSETLSSKPDQYTGCDCRTNDSCHVRTHGVH